MNFEYIQNLQHKLQKRIERLNAFENSKLQIFFHYLIKQYWFFLKSHPVIFSIAEELSCRFKYIDSQIDLTSHSFRIYDTEDENAAACYFMLQKLTALDDQAVMNSSITPYASRNEFKQTFLLRLHEYIDERLSDERVTLTLLTRYKHKCEWFQKKKLFHLWNDNKSKGEKNLALHLYEYLHDQGSDFIIEPSSASGEVDLIVDQRSEERLVADAKIFDGSSRGKSYISKGFRQIYQYLLDYNQSIGYLIIYKVCEQDLHVSTKDKVQFLPFIEYNCKTILFLVIDLFPYNSSASKRKTLKSTIVTEDDLIKDIK